MSANDSSDSNDIFPGAEISLPRSVRFWLLLLFNIPSAICSLCLITHIISNRTQRYACQNHIILLILIFGLPIQLVDINFYLVFYHNGSFEPFKPIVCSIWWLIDNGFFNGSLILMAWLAIERHILIFHDRWHANRRRRLLFHYVPMLVLAVYILLFYIYGVFFLSCENTYDYTLPVCGTVPCYQLNGVVGMWDSLVNDALPIAVEMLASVSLIVRVQWQKHRLRQSNKWRRQRRMVFQLLLVSGLNISLNLAIPIIYLAHLLGLPANYGIEAQAYFFFLGYFFIFLFPFASLCQFPDFRRNFRNKLCNVVSRQLGHTAPVPLPATILPMSRLA